MQASWRWASRTAFILFLGLCASNVLLPAIARAQFAASARMSVADILAALVGQDISADSYTATASSGSGFLCSSALAECVDLGPGAANTIGTNGSAEILIGNSNAVIARFGDSTLVQSGQITLTNGALTVNGSVIRNLSTGAVFVDDPEGLEITPQASTPSCAASNAGTFSTLTSTGAPFYCDGTAARQLVTQTSWSSSLDFAAFANQVCQTITFTATGAVKDEAVALGGCGSVFGGDTDLTCEASITANDEAAVRLCCIEAAGCADLTAITFTVTALR
jgi:hypothetical protein